MSWNTLTVNTENMDPGKFYAVFTDSNGTTLLIPMSEYELRIAEVSFPNPSKYFELELPPDVSVHSISLFEDQGNGVEKPVNESVDFFVKSTPTHKLVYFHTNQPYTGRLSMLYKK